ncbi:MAG: ribbon-helix-helix protein, CopG family [Rhodococcus sp.]|nr:ribbon-helix-helix protein, CopG family [Rhodococcus sp. (in: high G+C Gram-positive bacteria)]
MPTSIRLSAEIEARIKRLAAETGRSQSFYLNQIIERGIDEVEWEYSIMRDVEAHRAGNLETVSHEDLKADLGLED